MSDRIIRDELLRSHRFVGLSSDTPRQVFIAFILCADDLGNAEATSTAMGIMMVRHVSDEVAAKWLSELADVDLLRIYEDSGKRYIHIPRFRQRLRYPNGKHPRPPSNIECNEIKALAAKVRPQSDRSLTTVSPKTAEVKRSEEKRSKPFVRSANAPAPAGFLKFWQAWPANPRKVNRKGALERWGKQGYEQCTEAILAHVNAMKGTDQWREFCPAPVTYLNQARWEDGVPVEAKRKERLL